MKSKLILSLLLVTAGAVSTFSSKAWYGRCYSNCYSYEPVAYDTCDSCPVYYYY